MAKVFDCHYDLLTIFQFMLDNKNKYYNAEKLFEICKMYNKNNIIGSIVNLFFMSAEEMKNELDIDVSKVNLVDVFENVVQLIEIIKENNIIESDTKFLYSIEGCDWLNDVNDLDALYEKGLRSILPVWNCKNKYGSGNRTDMDLTEEGVNLITKAVQLGIIIDVSHANEKTFSSTIKLIKKLILEGHKPIVIASHSNCRTICNRKRNLTDEQIKSLMEVNGYLGLFSNGNFVSFDNEKIDMENRKINFLNLIDYVIRELNFPVDKLLLSTDDMDYHPDVTYHNLGTFNLENLANEIEQLLLSRYSQDLVEKIMYKNSLEIFEKCNKYRKRKNK